MKQNIFLIIEYDGSRYHGWQRQKNEPTIQETIETAISAMTRQKITLTGSGRTDAGVHALGQTANFSCETKLTPEIFLKGLNSLLPDDIVIKTCRQVHDRFHARYDVIGKTYQYTICNQNLPVALGRQFSWFIRKKLDLEKIRKAIHYIIGVHDFKAFEATGSPRSHTIRTVFNAEISEAENNRILFSIRADGFLRYMVRNLVGTLVEIGHGKLRPEDMEIILLSRNRNNAGATAPPHGLCLVSVEYPPFSNPDLTESYRLCLSSSSKPTDTER
jgi:tRNA pseudouridine38-40 synthase